MVSCRQAILTQLDDDDQFNQESTKPALFVYKRLPFVMPKTLFVPNFLRHCLRKITVSWTDVDGGDLFVTGKVGFSRSESFCKNSYRLPLG